MFKRWRVLPKVGAVNSDIAAQCGPLVGEIMLKRGLSASDVSFVAELSDPFLMKDMDKAVAAVTDALEQGKKITVYGDYDCDGVCAVTIMYSYLEAMGADVDYYIPDRFTEGYGMNVKALEKLVNQGTELVITVDNGISAINEAKFLKENGVGLVITDHHQPYETLPECEACLDPHRTDDASPFEHLCGAGVALVLCIALEGDSEFILDRYSDIAALATVADVVPLKGENRFIVRRGLENIHNEQNAGLTKLIKVAKRSPENLTATDAAFYIAPKINAAGRIDSAEKAVQLLLCDEDFDRAETLASELLQLNSERQQIGDKIFDEAHKMIAENPMIAKQRVIVLAKEGWHSGIIGIVCSRILEEYGKPVVMIAINGDKASGSMRSVEGYSAFRMLTECSEVLTKYGGHLAAGGFSLPADKIAEFTEKIHSFSLNAFPKMPEYGIYADMDVTGDMLTIDNVAMLRLLEPFGEGNESPLFRMTGCTISGKTPRGEDGRYTALRLTHNGITVSAISFNTAFEDFYPNDGDSIDVIAAAEINEYNNRKSVQLRIVDFRPSGFAEDKYFAAIRVYEEICRGEGCDKRLLPRVIPQNRDELKLVYDMIRISGGKTADHLFAMSGRVNYCQLRVALDAFAEAGMISVSERGTIQTAALPQKQDLFAEGGYLDRLKKSLA